MGLEVAGLHSPPASEEWRARRLRAARGGCLAAALGTAEGQHLRLVAPERYLLKTRNLEV
jgi:hypothetical protein